MTLLHPSLEANGGDDLWLKAFEETTHGIESELVPQELLSYVGVLGMNEGNKRCYLPADMRLGCVLFVEREYKLGNPHHTNVRILETRYQPDEVTTIDTVIDVTNGVSSRLTSKLPMTDQAKLGLGPRVGMRPSLRRLEIQEDTYYRERRVDAFRCTSPDDSVDVLQLLHKYIGGSSHALTERPVIKPVSSKLHTRIFDIAA